MTYWGGQYDTIRYVIDIETMSMFSMHWSITNTYDFILNIETEWLVGPICTWFDVVAQMM